jgi:hypothetical protein
MKYLLLLALLFTVPAYAGDFHISVGLGVHDPAYDWHMHDYKEIVDGKPQTFGAINPYAENPLGLVQVTYKIHRFTFGLVHISSIPNHTDDHGLNIAYVMVDIY